MSNKTLSTSTTLQHVVDETLGPVGHTFLSSAAIRELLQEFPGSIQVDVATRDEHHNVCARATEKGIEIAFGGSTPSEEHAVTPAPTSTRFKIEDGYQIPPPRRGIQAEPRYPFALLNRGQSFMVPATPERPNPVKALASTVSSANKRMQRHGKKFIIRAVEGGARVWRIE